MTFDGAFGFDKNLVAKTKIGFDIMDEAKKKDFTKSKPEKDKDQALESIANRDKCIGVGTWVFQGFNFHISETTMKVKVPRRWKWVIKDNWYGEIFHYDNPIKT